MQQTGNKSSSNTGGINDDIITNRPFMCKFPSKKEEKKKKKRKKEEKKNRVYLGFEDVN